MRSLAILIGLACFIGGQSAWAASDVTNTRHNLSTNPPAGITRSVASSTVSQICVFCHTPHNSLPAAQLWNRPDSAATYTPYDSTTLTLPLAAKPGQPTGKSRLCLSCHDGTVALGALQNPPANNDLGSTFLTAADRGFLDTDLRDDHPISFDYDAGPYGGTSEIKASGSITLPLETVGTEAHLQCTTCHEPHEADPGLRPFLRMTTASGALCLDCHDKAGWTNSTHQSSTLPVATSDVDNRRPEWFPSPSTVASHACLGCHTPHNSTATNPARLLAKNEENTCYGCHDANGPGSNIQGEFAKTGGIHPVASATYTGLHDATKVEDPLSMPLHVECADCHNPHTVDPSNALPMVSFNPNDPLNSTIHMDPNAATNVNSLISGVTGVDTTGAVTATVTKQHELCFKCHGTAVNTCGTGRCGAPKTHNMIRADMVNGDPLTGGTAANHNIRDRTVSGSGVVSWHPIVSNNSANNSEVPSLKTTIPLNASTSLIYCTDCHNGDASAAAGGTGPNGPHGSSWEGLMAQEYTFNTDPAGSTAFYALCYKCHDEAIILSSASFNKHQPHIQNRGGSCMLCHDPHGSFVAGRLINFLWMSDGAEVIDCIRSKGGGTQPCAAATPKPLWTDTGSFTGRCDLVCHGTSHAKTY